jgi:hypothetical protein
MPTTEMIAGIAGGLFILTGFIYFFRLVQAGMLHRTLRDAIARDSAMAEGLVERIDSQNAPNEEFRGDDRNGLLLLALGIATAGFTLIVNDLEWLRYGLGAALFPTLAGAALLLRHFLLRRFAERDSAGGA